MQNNPEPGIELALVTGAERGLGRELARQLCGLGMGVFVTSMDLALSEPVAAALRAAGGAAWPLQLDVTDDASVAAAAAAIRAEHSRLDVLVNNAGICIDDPGGAIEADLGVVRRTLETNLLGAWRVSQAFAPLLRAAPRGRIVNISSGMGQLETMGFDSPAYRVSKTGLNALTGMLAAQLADAGILVNAADPGWMRTEMGGPQAPLSVEEGAVTPLWLATNPPGTGGFYFNRRLTPW